MIQKYNYTMNKVFYVFFFFCWTINNFCSTENTSSLSLLQKTQTEWNKKGVVYLEQAVTKQVQFIHNHKIEKYVEKIGLIIAFIGSINILYLLAKKSLIEFGCLPQPPNEEPYFLKQTEWNTIVKWTKNSVTLIASCGALIALGFLAITSSKNKRASIAIINQTKLLVFYLWPILFVHDTAYILQRTTKNSSLTLLGDFLYFFRAYAFSVIHNKNIKHLYKTFQKRYSRKKQPLLILCHPR